MLFRSPYAGHYIVACHWIAAEDGLRRRLPVGAGAGKQIGDGPLAPIGQLREGKAELLEDCDAGIVAVEITPLIHTAFPEAPTPRPAARRSSERGGELDQG